MSSLLNMLHVRCSWGKRGEEVRVRVIHSVTSM